MTEANDRRILRLNAEPGAFPELAPWLSAPAGEDYAVTPGWINYHLLEHEAGHRAEILRLVRKWVGRPITR